MKDLKVKIKIVNDDEKSSIKLPFYASEGAAGMDLSAKIREDVVIKKGEIALIPTGIAIALPNNETVAYIYARSGLATKYGVTLANCVGVIDSDYRGEIKVGLINLGKEDYTVKNGDRIAQLVFAPVFRAELDLTDELTETDRGSGGFGSTGK